jgi:hypothetical protein
LNANPNKHTDNFVYLFPPPGFISAMADTIPQLTEENSSIFKVDVPNPETKGQDLFRAQVCLMDDPKRKSFLIELPWNADHSGPDATAYAAILAKLGYEEEDSEMIDIRRMGKIDYILFLEPSEVPKRPERAAPAIPGQ